MHPWLAAGPLGGFCSWDRRRYHPGTQEECPLPPPHPLAGREAWKTPSMELSASRSWTSLTASLTDEAVRMFTAGLVGFLLVLLLVGGSFFLLAVLLFLACLAEDEEFAELGVEQ